MTAVIASIEALGEHDEFFPELMMAEMPHMRTKAPDDAPHGEEFRIVCFLGILKVIPWAIDCLFREANELITTIHRRFVASST
jgi:hypothetical protein